MGRHYISTWPRSAASKSKRKPTQFASLTHVNMPPKIHEAPHTQMTFVSERWRAREYNGYQRIGIFVAYHATIDKSKTVAERGYTMSQKG